MNSFATSVFTAHTVLQGSQQGNETSIQHVSVIVQTHQVAVEHPAELQAESTFRAGGHSMRNDLTSTRSVHVQDYRDVTFPLSMHKSSVWITSELQQPH